MISSPRTYCWWNVVPEPTSWAQVLLPHNNIMICFSKNIYIYIYYDIDLSNMDEVLQTIYIFYFFTHTHTHTYIMWIFLGECLFFIWVCLDRIYSSAPPNSKFPAPPLLVTYYNIWEINFNYIILYWKKKRDANC